MQFVVGPTSPPLADRAGQRLAALGTMPEPESLLTDAAILEEILPQPDDSQATLEEMGRFELGRKCHRCVDTKTTK